MQSFFKDDEVMSAYPMLPVFTDAFIADTTHLNAQETGAYWMLLMIAWRSDGCRLPDDDDKLSRWARTDKRTWSRIKATVMAFWTKEDGFWVQGRLSRERDFVNKKADANRLNGLHGGRPKSLKTNEPDKANGFVSETQTKAPIPTPIPIEVESQRSDASTGAPAGPQNGKSLAEARGPIEAMAARLFAQFPAFAAAGANAGLLDTSPLLRLIVTEDCDPVADVEVTICGILARAGARPPRSWSYFASAIREAKAARLAAGPTAKPTAVVDRPIGTFGLDPDGIVRFTVDEHGYRRHFAADYPDMERHWLKALRNWADGEGRWNRQAFGPAPDEEGCHVPEAMFISYREEVDRHMAQRAADRASLEWMRREETRETERESTAMH